MGLGWRERGGNQSKANGMKRIIQNKYAHEEGHREYGGCDELAPLHHCPKKKEFFGQWYIIFQIPGSLPQ